MENKEQLEKAYQALKLTAAAVVKLSFNNKIDLPVEIGINTSTGSSIMAYIPYDKCKTKISALKYINNLINELVMTEHVEMDEMVEILNQLQKLHSGQVMMAERINKFFDNVTLNLK